MIEQFVSTPLFWFCIMAAFLFLLLLTRLLGEMPKQGRPRLSWAVVLVALAIGYMLVGCAPVQAETVTPYIPAVTSTDTLPPAPAMAPTPTATASLRPALVCTVKTPGDEVLNVRKGPGMETEIVGGVVAGSRLVIIGESGDWYQVRGKYDGYVFAAFCTVGKEG